MLKHYFFSKIPTPIFNQAKIALLFREPEVSCLLDPKQLFRPLEMIALPNALFEVKRKLVKPILEVTLKCYSATTPLFIDSRFGELLENPSKEVSLPFPKAEDVLKRCRAFQGLPYIWGGNYSAGIPEMKVFYPPSEEKNLSRLEEKRWILQGVDCSGLLYEATGGVTPRNTRELLFFGKPVSIQGKKGREILKLLLPLDLIVWKGHVLIVLNDKEWIESRHSKGGVVIISPEERLREILEKEKKIPVDDPAKAKQDSNLFVVRRWRAG